MTADPPRPPPMRKVAVFGNAGGGKSRLARRLAAGTGLPLYCLDKIQFPEGRYRRGEVNGGKLSTAEYADVNADLLRRDAWVIDGFDTFTLTWQRFAQADTLVYIDLPLFTHYSWVTKRLVAGLFKTPAGWPEATPVWAASLSSYRVLWRCHRLLTPRYRQFVAEARSAKRVHHLTSGGEIDAFLLAIERNPIHIPVNHDRPSAP